MRPFWQILRLPSPSRCLKNYQFRQVFRLQVAFVVAVIVLTAAIGQRFYDAPRLDVGTAAPQTLYAPSSTVIEDSRATEEKRKIARKDSTSVMVPDVEVNETIQRSLRRALEQGDTTRQMAGKFPFEQTKLLSLTTQSYLRQAPDEDWQQIQAIATLGASISQKSTPDNALTPDQKRVIAELINYRREIGSGEYYTLLQKISQVRQNYILALASLNPSDEAASQSLDAVLLELSDRDWQQFQAKTLRVTERMLAQGISRGLAPENLQTAVRLQVKDEVPKIAEPLAIKLLLEVLQPNLLEDAAQSHLAAEKAAQEIEPVTVDVRKGEPIVRAGQEISSRDFALLDHFDMSRREIDWWGLVGFSSLVAAAVSAYCLVEWQFHSRQRQRDRLLLLLLALSTPLAVLLRLPPTNLPAIGLLVGIFYGSPLGVAMPALLAFLLPLGGIPVNWTSLVSSAIAGILCGFWGGRPRSREELAWLGAAAGVLQGFLYLLLNLIWGEVLFKLPANAFMHGLTGIAWCVVAIGISPYLEQVFDLATTIRLVELANPNCYLLKRLAAEAPGTFQHTLFVATLAEAAARALGCNVELVRTGTLYHDIGKMHDPQGFIENQMGGVNKHDVIDQPWKSADIIKKHVSEGLVMARKCRLPSAVQAFIPEHQGTMLIAYFYHQAQQRSQQNPDDKTLPPVVEVDFRYDGPTPRSRETGILMLADSCEAALRSLKEVSCDEALIMVNKILRARWQDNQLIHSGLTREDLAKIATIFVEVWQQFNHRRIAYPNLASSPQPSAISS